MATVELDRRGWEDGDLPDVCMQCGGHAPDRVRRTFVWQPSWVVFMIFIHVLVFLIVSLAMRKKRLALVPMCGEHRNHWRSRTLKAWLSFASAVVVCVVGIIAVNALSPADPVGPICGVVVLTLIAWIVAIVVIQWGTIRPTGMAEGFLTLKNVSPEFSEAYENFLDEEDARDKRKIRLDRDARRRWNESPTGAEGGERSRSIREDDPDDDLPTKNDNIRPG